MGRGRRQAPARLPEKLFRIREAFGVTQSELVKMLGAEREIKRSYISEYESGEREPPTPLLLGYARLAGVCVEVLLDDELDLPGKIPAAPPHRAVRGKTTSRRK